MTLTFPHSVTYWAPGAGDGYGGPTFAAPVTIRGRWEDRPSRVLTKDGRETVVADSRFYTLYGIAVNGYALKGISSATTPPTTARRIMGVVMSPSIDGKVELKKGLL